MIISTEREVNCPVSSRLRQSSAPSRTFGTTVRTASEPRRFGTAPAEISRAGTSTTGLIWRGFDGESSFHLSFLLSIPTVFLAEILLYLGGGLFSLSPADGLLLAVASFAFGYLAIDAVLRVVRRVNLGYVALGMGILIIVVSLAGGG